MNGGTVRVVRPTKIELIRLRRRLALARKIHRILRERLMILVSEFMDVARTAVEARMDFEGRLQELYSLRMGVSASVLGPEEPGVPPPPGQLTLRTGERSVAGVRTAVLSFELPEPPPRAPPSEPLPLSRLDAGAEDFWRSLARLAEVETSLRNIGEEIRRVRRLVNVMEHMLIPRLERTIRLLSMKFEEREREEKTRLKHVKAMLQRRK